MFPTNPWAPSLLEITDISVQGRASLGTYMSAALSFLRVKTQPAQLCRLILSREACSFLLCMAARGLSLTATDPSSLGDLGIIRPPAPTCHPLHLPPLSSNGSHQRVSAMKMYKHMSSVSRSNGNSIKNLVCIRKLKICTIMRRAIQTNNYINSRYGWHGNYNRYFQQI